MYVLPAKSPSVDVATGRVSMSCVAIWHPHGARLRSDLRFRPESDRLTARTRGDDVFCINEAGKRTVWHR